MTTRGKAAARKMAAAMKHLSHGLMPLLLAPVRFRRRWRNPAETSGYDIRTAGYKTPGGKAVATVWENDTELDTHSNGHSHGEAYSICAVPRYD